MLSSLQHISSIEFLLEYGHKPDYSKFKVFGCLCYPFLRPYNKHKLEYRSAGGVFLGYSNHHKGYKILLPNGKVVISRDVLFDESIFPYSRTKESTLPSSTTQPTLPPAVPTSQVVAETFYTPQGDDSNSPLSPVQCLDHNLDPLTCEPYSSPDNSSSSSPSHSQSNKGHHMTT